MPQSSIAEAHILVIDEDAQARGVLVDELQGLGAAHVRETGDPLEALEIMRSGAADLLVTERYLHLVRFIRANNQPEIAALPIVAVSAHHRDADIHEAIDAGVDEFVPKPVEPVALLEGLMRALSRARISSARGPI